METGWNILPLKDLQMTTDDHRIQVLVDSDDCEVIFNLCLQKERVEDLR